MNAMSFEAPPRRREPALFLPASVVVLVAGLIAIHAALGYLGDETRAQIYFDWGFIPGRFTYLLAPEWVSAYMTRASADMRSAEARQQASVIFTNRCSLCHGATGHGDGPASAALNPKPRNFHDADWQKVVSDGEIEKAIQYGGASVGKAPLMPPNPDLVEKPDIVAALREHVRSFNGQ